MNPRTGTGRVWWVRNRLPIAAAVTTTAGVSLLLAGLREPLQAAWTDGSLPSVLLVALLPLYLPGGLRRRRRRSAP